MGLFDKFDKAMDKARQVARDVQDQATTAVGQGMRTATGQGDANLPSVQGGRDVFAPLVAAANDLGYPYVARAESVDSVGWTLHENRLGLNTDQHDYARGAARVSVEALNRPIASLVEWEAAKALLGGREESVWGSGEQVRLLTKQIDDGWQCSFLRHRLAVRVQFCGPTATEHLARDFATSICWNRLDLAAVDAWCGEHGVDPLIEIGLQPTAGVSLAGPSAPAEPVRMQLDIPAAADAVAATIAADDPTRIIHDWDEFHPGADLLGFEPTGRTELRIGGWEGPCWRGPAGEFAHILAIDFPEAVREPDRFAAMLLESQAEAPEFAGNTIATGLDYLGYPTAHITIGELPFLVRISGPAGDQGGRELISKLARAAIYAMPE